VQFVQVFLEEFDYILAIRFAVRNVDALGCASCNVDHLVKGWVIQGL